MKTPVTYILSRTALLAILILSCRPAFGTILYTSFSGGGSGFNSVDSWQTDIEQETAADFTPSVTQALSQIRIAVDWFQGPNSFRIFLTTNAGGVPSTGTPLEVWDTTPTINPFPSTPGIVTLTSIVNPVLTQGTTYWIILSAGDETIDDTTQSHAHWYLNTAGKEGVARREREDANQSWDAWQGLPTDTKTAFDVSGTPVPEPSSIGTALIGVAALVLRYKSTRRG